MSNEGIKPSTRERGTYDRDKGFTEDDEARGMQALHSDDLTSETQSDSSNDDADEIEELRKSFIGYRALAEEKIKKLEQDLVAAKKTPGTADDTAVQKKITDLEKKVRDLEARKPKEVIRTVEKEWSGNTVEDWIRGPKLEGPKLARIRAGLRAQAEVHSSDATRLISAKKYLEMDQIEKKKPFWMRMAVGALAGVGLSALASPIAGLAGLTWLTPLLWRAGTSVVAGAAIGGMVNNRLKKRNFKHAGIWGLAAGIVAGIGSFIGGQVVSDWINGTATGGNKGSREFSPFNEKQSYAPPTNLNRDNPSGIYNV